MNSSFCDLTFIQKKDGKKEKGIIDMYDYKIVEQVFEKEKEYVRSSTESNDFVCGDICDHGNCNIPVLYAGRISSCCAIFCV